MKAHPWIERVHADMLAGKTPLKAWQIKDQFGEPVGNQTSTQRISVAVSRGWFAVWADPEDGRYFYSAKERSTLRMEWTPSWDAVLVEYWPAEGEKCLSRFPPQVTRSSLVSRLEVLNKALPEDRKVRKIKLKPKEKQAKPVLEISSKVGDKSRDGLPFVASIWALASAIGGQL